jgi:hypothetical protein
MGEDATDYFVRTPGGLRKSVLFDEKEHRVVKARLDDRKDRVVKYGDGRSKPRLSALEYLCRLSPAGIGTPFQPVVESRCGAVAVGSSQLLPPLSVGGAAIEVP